MRIVNLRDMKKLLLLIAVLIAGMAASAQTFNQATVWTVDTLTNTETAYLTLPKVTRSVESISGLVLAETVTGTAAGTILLQGSLDGTTYVTLTDVTGYISIAVNDTTTIVDNATFGWNVYKPAFLYYRMALVQTGTSTTEYTGHYLIKK